MLSLFKTLLGLGEDSERIRQASRETADSAVEIANNFKAIAAATTEFRKQVIPSEIGEFVDLPLVDVIDSPVVPKPPKTNGRTRKTRTTAKS